MSKTLNKRISELEAQVQTLTAKLKNLSENTEAKRLLPETRIKPLNRAIMSPADIKSGWGGISGGTIIWNDAELARPPFGAKPGDPKEGYHKHSHSQYSGGALDINTLQLVEYDFDNNLHNPNCQGFFPSDPEIKKDGNIERIGELDIEFDPDTRKWIAGAKNIDVENTYLIQYVWRKDGDIVDPDTPGAAREVKKDENGNEMKSVLLYTEGDTDNENLNKSNVWWDKDAKCWRFYAILKPYPIEET